MGTFREKFKKNFNRLMMEHGYQQKDIAENIGAKQSAVSDWSLGNRFPRIDRLEDLCAFFGVGIEELFK